MEETPLTRECFHSWVREKFDPHIEGEASLRTQLLTVELSIDKWVRVATVGLSLIVLLGGAIVALLAWGLQEKNSDLRELRVAIVANQNAITGLASAQRALADEIARMRVRDERMLELLAQMRKER